MINLPWVSCKGLHENEIKLYNIPPKVERRHAPNIEKKK